jgi:cobalamin biosynthesis Co2+ chelatase CbiK
MATTSDMNTPEHATKDNNNKNNNNKEYIDKLQAQFVQNQIRQIIHGRDYGRILRESNKPAQWYKASPITRSVYYYDPNYQKYLQQQSKLLTNTRVNMKKKNSLYHFYLFLF